MAALIDIIGAGATDQSVTIRIVDSGDGTPETGVVYNTAGIDLWYRREGAAKTSITEATLASLTTAHTDGGFLHIADGEYRLDVPDAAFASGAAHVDIGGTVTGMVVIGGRVSLSPEVSLATSVAPTSEPVLGTDSVESIIAWLGAYVGRLHKATQTSTTTTVRNAGDSGDVASSTVTDNGTTATFGAFS